MKKLSRYILGIVLTSIAILGLAGSTYAYTSNQLIIARGGGGESFGDGGFDSGSSSSWSSSDSDWSSSGTSSGGSGGSPLISCCIIGVIITIIVIDLIIKKRGGQGFIHYNKPTITGSGTGQAGANAQFTTNKSMTTEEINQKLTELKTIDPDFDEQKFKTHVKKVFMAIQEGWTNRDQTVCRPFMTEEIYQSHEMQLDNMRKAKIINVLENIVVGSVDFAKIELSQDYHKITMQVRAAMKDYKVSEDDKNKIIEGTKEQLPPFTEYWVFMRKATARTKIKDGFFDRKCPNCGAPIDVDVAGKCKYCNATVVNGDFDWVLSEIIQKSEWIN